MSDFKGRHFRGEIVLWAVRWYCRYPISCPSCPPSCCSPTSSCACSPPSPARAASPHPSNLTEAVQLLARLGGWLGRARDPPGAQPGPGQRYPQHGDPS